MDFANWLMAAYNSESIIQLSLAAACFAAITGHFVHRFLGEASFGTLANAGMILVAILTASTIDNYRIAALVPDHLLRISTVATFIAATLILTLASVRQWTRDRI